MGRCGAMKAQKRIFDKQKIFKYNGKASIT